jgi:hypothetical protein
LQQTFDHRDSHHNHTNIALLYGCGHCTDLHRQLVSLGFKPTLMEWRTAWSVAVMAALPEVEKEAPWWSSSSRPPAATTTMTSTTVTTPAEGMVVVLPVAYLLLGGLDWIATWQSVAAHHADSLTLAFDALVYLVRHVLLYVAWSKFILDWNPADD